MNLMLLRTCAVAFLIAVGSSATAETRSILNINPVWRFQIGSPQGQPYSQQYDDSQWELVSLPHSHALFDANLSGFSTAGRTVGWYRRAINIPKEWSGKRVFLEFKGAMQATTLWVNGKKVGEYTVSGFDSFDFDITPYVELGANQIAVCVDNRANPQLPPDGQKMDYVLFGGLYRDVNLHVTDPLHLVFPWEGEAGAARVRLPVVSQSNAVVEVASTLRNDSKLARKCSVVNEIRDASGNIIKTMSCEQEVGANSELTVTQQSQAIRSPHLWSTDDPYLYHVVTTVREGDREVDRWESPLGIRWVEFDKNKGFFLNGQHVKLVGANRHQTWPFIGNAVPGSLQWQDAKQMKAMGINWVRLSHYPHDPHFLDALDQLGIMAVAEGPTWMDAGDAVWLKNLEASFRRMVRRDRNHPCIIAWNTSVNHHGAQAELVRVASEEDPDRPRGQDTVSLPMAFTHLEIPGDGTLVIEHTGHMFPTERGSSYVPRQVRTHDEALAAMVNREYDQARRHFEQVNAAYQVESNSGLAVWCMYDYNTFHNINAPGLVWHGVCDLFRFPKASYWWHISELTEAPMVHVTRIDRSRVAVFSNCQQVRLFQDKGDGCEELATQQPEKGFKGDKGQQISYSLRHPPFIFGVDPDAYVLKAEGLVDGTVKASDQWRRPGRPAALLLASDRPTITADGADLSRIVVTAIDTNGVPVDTCDAAITFKLDGIGQLIGENPTKLRAGKMIILAQSGFVPGSMTITAYSEGLKPAVVTLKSEPVPPWMDTPKHLPANQPSARVMEKDRAESRYSHW